MVVAARDIPARTKIEADMVEIVAIKTVLYSNSDIAQVVGTVALCDIVKGEPIGAPVIDMAWRLNDGVPPDPSIKGWPNCTTGTP